jgi:hypothetical protein
MAMSDIEPEHCSNSELIPIAKLSLSAEAYLELYFVNLDM